MRQMIECCLLWALRTYLYLLWISNPRKKFVTARVKNIPFNAYRGTRAPSPIGCVTVGPLLTWYQFFFTFQISMFRFALELIRLCEERKWTIDNTKNFLCLFSMFFFWNLLWHSASLMRIFSSANACSCMRWKTI